MGGLQVLEEVFAADGFQVLGFLSNNFGNQGGDDEEIDACTDDYGVTFEQFVIDDVIGSDPRPVWDWLLAQENPGPANGIAPTWNFHKYLVSREGEVVQHWASAVAPPTSANDPNFDTNAIVVAIEQELAK